MEAISAGKQLGIVRLYFSGLSYEEIGGKVGVAKGSVANVVAELKAGHFPQVTEPPDQVEALREIAIDLKKAKLSTGEAVTGLAVLNALKKLGVEPAEVSSWASLCHELSALGQADVSVFVKAAIVLDEVQSRTGLSAEDIEKKASEAEQAAVKLEALTVELKRRQEQLNESDEKQQDMAAAAEKLGKRLNELRASVALKEKRESDLSEHVEQLEDRLQEADRRLSAARADEKALVALGLSLENLTGLVNRIAGIASRHGIAKEDLLDRFLAELERLDKGMILDEEVEVKKQEVAAVTQQVQKQKEMRSALEAGNGKLREEQAALKLATDQALDRFRQEMKAAGKIATDAAAGAGRSLSEELAKAMAEVVNLKQQSLDLGRDIGSFEAAIEANSWLRDLLGITRGERSVGAERARIIGLVVLRAMMDWLTDQRAQGASTSLLEMKLKSALEELEKWNPPSNGRR